MSIIDKVTLKSYFESGDTPTASQFIDLIDTNETHFEIVSYNVAGGNDVWVDVNLNQYINYDQRKLVIINHFNKVYILTVPTIGEYGFGAIATTSANYINISGYLETLNTIVDNHIADEANPHSVAKSDVGLSNVDNTSDANKPVSTAQQAALDLKANLAGAVFTGNVSTEGFLDVNDPTLGKLKIRLEYDEANDVSYIKTFDSSFNIISYVKLPNILNNAIELEDLDVLGKLINNDGYEVKVAGAKRFEIVHDDTAKLLILKGYGSNGIPYGSLELATISGGENLLKGNTTVSNYLTLNQTPSTDLHGANKKYVDDQITANVAGSTGTFTTNDGQTVTVTDGLITNIV